MRLWGRRDACTLVLSGYLGGVDRTAVRQRGLTLVLGTALTMGALWGGLWVLLLAIVAGQVPDPAAPDRGLPLPPVPDTWGEVLGGAALALVLALIDAAVLALGIALLFYGARARWPTRRLMWLPPVAAGACALLIAGGLAVTAVA